MNAFEEYLFERFAQEMRSWPLALARDIYVLSILISFVDDDVRSPELSLCFNTESNWQKNIFHASSEAEARWNTAFWLHDAGVTVCRQPYMNDSFTTFDEVDLRGVGLRDAFLTLRAPRGEGEVLGALFDACLVVTKRLHDDGVVLETCGRAVPVVWECTNDFGEEPGRLERMRRANLPLSLSDYENWM